ncbi:uncharacterized protein Triagg1_10271 [Trichoderma aggressivum f. europaeum]|uniref:Zn(2)-C6 fungal-type domain-containing protein n=1 Tax=Trichoderma aggressivum f. europaeum TaxID=173218 RepID=A0AAE1I5J3_9HYPO|nr:hypothetical protein Triagg1_10271 [Trichoderma aggressivum f. europaeum]
MSANSQSQLLTSFTGGNKMLEATSNDISYGSFVAAVDDIHKYSATSGSTSSSEAARSNLLVAVQNHRLRRNNVRSPQPALNSSFLGVSSPVDSSSDWPRQQPCAANNDDRAFSSSHQGYSLGHSRRPQYGTETRISTQYGPPHGHEHTGQELHRDVPYLDKKSIPFLPRGLLSDPLPLPGSSHTFVTDGLSSIPAAQPAFSPGQLYHTMSYSQPSPSVYSNQSSQDGALSITTSNPSDGKDAMANMPMPNIPEYAQEGFYGKSNHLIHDVKTQTDIQAIGSAEFSFPPSVWQQSPSVDPSTEYPSSETNSSTVSRGKGKGKRRAASITRPHRILDPDPHPFGNRGAHSQDRSQNAGISKRRPSNGQVHLLPKPRPHAVADGGGVSMVAGKPMPKKPRGKRTGPLHEGGRQLATKRRNERTVCIGCKMAKVLCDFREDGKACSRCSSSSGNALKPFVCVPASFIDLVQQGSTVLLALHIIYPLSANGFREPIELPSEIHVRQLLHIMDELRKSHHTIRVYGRQGILCELDLHACWIYINSNCSPTVHPFRQFIHGLKVQKQDTWKTCIRDGYGRPLNRAKLCDALLALDDMAPWNTYTLRSTPNNLRGPIDDEFETILAPDDPYQRQVIIAAAQLSRIIGRKIELEFYDQLKRDLANPRICHELVLDVGHTLMSLRRRLTLWTCHWESVSPSTSPEPESNVDDGRDGASRSRLKHLCQVLYVYFCYMRRRLPANEQESIRNMMVLYPEGEEEVQESFPQYESIDGFEEWLQFTDQPRSESDMDSDQMQ